MSHRQALPAIHACRHVTGLHHSFSYCGLQVWLAPRTGSNRPVWQDSSSRHIVGASSARSLPSERAPSLHTQKGNWYDELLSVYELTVSVPHSRLRSRFGAPAAITHLLVRRTVLLCRTSRLPCAHASRDLSVRVRVRVRGLGSELFSRTRTPTRTRESPSSSLPPNAPPHDFERSENISRRLFAI